MAKYKLILTLIITLCAVTTFAQPAQYTPMTAAGYQMKRLKVDSTLHLPSFCGVPTIRGSVAKEGALAIDTCGRFLYMWTRTGGWDTVNTSGGGGGSSTDTTSLSNRINLKVDSIRRVSDSVFAWINGVKFFQYKDSVGGGDFWKTSGTTDLTGNTLIQSDNLIQFNGINGEIPQFFVFSNDIRFITPDHNFSIIDLTTTTDTSTYKPLGIASDGKLAPLTSWVGGGIASSDTIYTQNPIMFINRNDSNIVFFNADTANAWRNTSIGIDSLKRSSDSVYARKNGSFIFQFKDSVGGGSGSDTAKVVIAQVHNATATTLLKGEVVYLFGSTGNIASVKRANNKSDATSSKTFGIVRRDIVAGGTGFITTQGQLEKLNLGSYAEGDVLWLDSIDGQFTKVKPQAPYHGVFLGIVERANNGNGLAYIKVQNGVELDEIHDVQINNILNNQIIVYSDTQQVWKNRNISSLIDTTLFQNKSLSANTIMANNTSATANATAQQFRDTSGVYPSGSINWTGTTAPSGTTTHTYRLTQVGKCVTVHIALVYAANGAGLTSIQLLLPPNAPTPAQPTGLTGSIFNMYPVYGQIVNTTNQTILSNAIRGFLRNNTAATGYEIFMQFTSAAPGQLGVTCQYWTN